MADNTVKNTVPGRNGGRLKTGGNPGNKGGTGRPPAPFKAMLAKLRESPELAKSLKDAIKDCESRAFPAALKLLSDYDTDKPAEKRELSGAVEVHVRIAREGRRVTAS